MNRATIWICLAIGACTGYTRVEPSPTLTDQRVRVRFRAPVSLTVTRTNGDTARLERAAEVTGRATSITRDSLRLVVWTAHGPRGVDLHAPENSRTAISRADVVSVEQWKIDEDASSKTVLFLGATAIIVSIGFLIRLAAIVGAD